jgi:hypothetical protein
VRDLAEAAGLHRNTVPNLEIGRYAGHPQTQAIIEQVPARAGIDFIDENGGGPAVRLRNRQRPKQMYLMIIPDLSPILPSFESSCAVPRELRSHRFYYTSFSSMAITYLLSARQCRDRALRS